jgi:hypothetical protein
MIQQKHRREKERCGRHGVKIPFSAPAAEPRRMWMDKITDWSWVVHALPFRNDEKQSIWGESPVKK